MGPRYLVFCFFAPLLPFSFFFSKSSENSEEDRARAPHSTEAERNIEKTSMQLKMSLSSHSLQIPTLVLKPSSSSRNPKFLRIPQQRSTSRSSTPLPQHMQDSHQHYYKFSRKTFQCMSQIGKQKQQQQEYQVERLFSNLNQATLKREPGMC